MANPTQYYGWTLPTEGSDPWYQTFDDMVSATDVSVRSVENITGTRYTLVVSTNGSLLINSDTTGAVVGQAYFGVMSSSPFGRFVGSFSLVRSGAAALFAVSIQGRLDHVLDSIVRNDLRLAVRGVVQGNGMTSLSVPQNSLFWSHAPGVTEVQQQLRWTAAVSLGPGTYSVEWQAQVMSATTGAGSEWRSTTTDRFVAEVLEVNR